MTNNVIEKNLHYLEKSSVHVLVNNPLYKQNGSTQSNIFSLRCPAEKLKKSHAEFFLPNIMRQIANFKMWQCHANFKMWQCHFSKYCPQSVTKFGGSMYSKAIHGNKHFNKQIWSADSSYNTPNEPHINFTLWYFNHIKLTSHYFDPTMLPQLPGLAASLE